MMSGLKSDQACMLTVEEIARTLQTSLVDGLSDAEVMMKIYFNCYQ